MIFDWEMLCLYVFDFCLIFFLNLILFWIRNDWVLLGFLKVNKDGIGIVGCMKKILR